MFFDKNSFCKNIYKRIKGKLYFSIQIWLKNNTIYAPGLTWLCNYLIIYLVAYFATIIFWGVYMKKIIKWTNKYSNECGYVRKVSNKEKHFVNCTEAAGARKFRSEKEANGIIETLVSYGEANNNYFSVIDRE